MKDLEMSTSKPKAVGAVNIHFHYIPPGNVGPSRVDEEDKSLTAKFNRDLEKSHARQRLQNALLFYHKEMLSQLNGRKISRVMSHGERTRNKNVRE